MGQIPGQVRLADPEELRAFRRMLEEYHLTRQALAGQSIDLWLPPTDVYETPSDLVIKMSVPGVQIPDLLIRISGDTVTICGRRENRACDEIVSFHQMEIRYGYFERRIIIHRPFDGSGARASYEDGFLTVRIPKAAKPVKRVVSIRVTF